MENRLVLVEDMMKTYSSMSTEQQKQAAPGIMIALGYTGLDWLVKEHPNYAIALIIGLGGALGYTILNK